MPHLRPLILSVSTCEQILCHHFVLHLHPIGVVVVQQPSKNALARSCKILWDLVGSCRILQESCSQTIKTYNLEQCNNYEFEKGVGNDHYNKKLENKIFIIVIACKLYSYMQLQSLFVKILFSLRSCSLLLVVHYIKRYAALYMHLICTIRMCMRVEM